jgi:hypothetical protein
MSVLETRLDTSESVVDDVFVNDVFLDDVEEPLSTTPEVSTTTSEEPLPTTPEVSTTTSEEPVVPEKPKENPTLDIESKAIVETFVDAIDGDFDMDTVMELVPKLIKHVQSYNKFTGPQKKKLVIKMLNHIIDITDTPYVDDATWDPIMKKLVPKLIDTLVEVNNGKLVLKKRKCTLLRVLMPSCCCSKPSATAE